MVCRKMVKDTLISAHPRHLNQAIRAGPGVPTQILLMRNEQLLHFFNPSTIRLIWSSPASFKTNAYTESIQLFFAIVCI